MMDALNLLHATLQAPPFQCNPSSHSDQASSHQLAQSVKALDDWVLHNKWTGPPPPTDLSRAIDQALLENLDELVASADSLIKEIDGVHTEIGKIRGVIDSISLDFETTQSSTSQFAQAASEQQSIIDSVTNQQTEIADFLAQYTLTSSEIAQLSAHSSDLSEEFFTAFDRAVSINANARIHLDFPNSTLSQDIVSVVEEMLQTSHDQLYAWIEARLPTLAAISPEIPQMLPMAITRLVQDRPVLANTLFEEAIAFRKTAVSRWFSDTVITRDSAPLPSNTLSVMPSSSWSGSSSILGRESNGGQVETERRAGDVFAWIHQAVSAEMSLWTIELAEKGTIPRNKAVGFVDVTLDAVTRMIYSKIEHIVSRASLPVAAAGTLVQAVDTVAAYKVYHVLGMNRDVLLKTFPLSASLVQITFELQQFCLKQFKDALDMQAQVLKSSRNVIDTSTLAPIPIVQRTVQSLQAVASTRDRYIYPTTHMVSSVSAASTSTSTSMELPIDRVGEFPRDRKQYDAVHSGDLERTQLRSVLDTLIDPCVQTFVVAASSNRLLNRMGGAVFIINCLGALNEAVSVLSSDKALALEKQIDIYMDSLITDHFDTLVRQSGMQSIFDKFQHNQTTDGDSLSNIELDPIYLKAALDKLDALLMTSLHRDLHPDCLKLNNPALVTQISAQGQSRFVKAYTAVYEYIQASKKYTGITMRSIDEVQSLFRT